MFPIIVLAAVFLLIAVRQVGRVRLQIWQVMCAGAAAVLLSGDIKPGGALRAVDWDVMAFLFGMFAAGQTITFLEFARIGLPLTFINAIIYWIFIANF